VVDRFKRIYVLYIVMAELKIADVARFQRNIQLPGWLAVPIIRISVFLLYKQSVQSDTTI